ncbi:putative methyltransferase C9orf114 [Athalia rosae]|uniref:putative methyltransferase C9orf114 n=1 Tax=Athalia rosae TaxID=37344 RepID=UPI00203322DD|nr:putative methyltransferase C9orf114 [Athalia rosae]
MAPVLPQAKNWKEHNRVHKENRKQWREQRLIRKVKKDNSENVVEETKRSNKTEKSRNTVSTISIAVPGSILDNAQSSELRTYLAGQIARAACIYKIDEVIVFNDLGDVLEEEKKKLRKDDTFGEVRVECLQLARILQYLECPQYLRKYFFPIHNDLKYAGVLNPLDAPHHLRQQDVSLFREGVVTNKPIKAGKGSQVNVGLLNDVTVDKVLTAGLRVTVKIPLQQRSPKKLEGIVVPPTVPRSEIGIYWGYAVRVANNLTEVITKCPYKEGYDITIGTSDKGTAIDQVPAGGINYNHGLIVFGGLCGLESALENDPHLNEDDPSVVFDKYFNICPLQGSRTIRTEEAILIALSELRTKLLPKNPSLENSQFQSFDKNMTDDKVEDE